MSVEALLHQSSSVSSVIRNKSFHSLASFSRSYVCVTRVNPSASPSSLPLGASAQFIRYLPPFRSHSLPIAAMTPSEVEITRNERCGLCQIASQSRHA